MPQAVSRIYAPKDLPSRLLLLSSKGDLTLIESSTLDIQHTRPLTESGNLLEAFVFSARSCSFISSPSIRTVVVLFYFFLNKIHVEVVGIDEEEGISLLGKGLIEESDTVSSFFFLVSRSLTLLQNVNNISCSTSGYISTICKCHLSYF